MKRYIRRLRWLILLGGFCAACSALTPVPGRVSLDDDALEDDEKIAWREAYGRRDSLPAVFVVGSDELNCSSDVNGEPGFNCPTVGCRQGCTGSPAAVHIVDTLPRSQGVLCHELEHVREIRDAVATLLMTPSTFAGYVGLADRKHRGPAWQPGGAVDKCNALLAERGR